MMSPTPKLPHRPRLGAGVRAAAPPNLRIYDASLAHSEVLPGELIPLQQNRQRP